MNMYLSRKGLRICNQNFRHCCHSNFLDTFWLVSCFYANHCLLFSGFSSCLFLSCKLLSLSLECL